MPRTVRRAKTYDASSVNEQEVPLPNAKRNVVSPGVELQPPLTHRGHGPGLIAFLPSLPASAEQPLDPEPVRKWAEEGFAVVAVTAVQLDKVKSALCTGIEAVRQRLQCDPKDALAVLVYEPRLLDAVVSAVTAHAIVRCVVAFGASTSTANHVPLMSHVPQTATPSEAVRGDAQGAVRAGATLFSYAATSPFFMLPQLHQSGEYVHSAANVAHTRSLAFVKQHVGGPYFPLEEIWDAHTAFEFETRSVAKTMNTMVQEPYVNHVPTMTGGIGRAKLSSFYRDHFIFNNPADLEVELISRTVGVDRVIDEFIIKMTHDKMVDWFLPGVPPTGKYLQVPFISVVNIRGDRLFHEHISTSTPFRRIEKLLNLRRVGPGDRPFPMWSAALSRPFQWPNDSTAHCGWRDGGQAARA